MKQLFLTFILSCNLICATATEIPYCMTTPIGYGSSATGGGNATPTLVSSVNELTNALKGSNKVIIVTQSLTLTSMITAQDMENITLLGMPGVSLSNLDTIKENSGILFVKRTNNLIIRNLTFIGPGAYDVDGNDLLCFENVTDAWVDHCDFQDGLDGNFDNKHSTDNITVSWCRFRYLKDPIAGGSGGSDDHRFSNLLGSSATDAPDDGTYNFTWAYCWWDYGCRQRMVRCRNASLHFLNCYWNTSVADYFIGPENADAYVEGCYMASLGNIYGSIFREFNNSTNGVKWVNSYYEDGSFTNINDRPVTTPSYTYVALSYSDAVTAVTNTSCGAGATLTVTNAADISTTCNDEVTTPDDTTPLSSDLTWKADDNDIVALGTEISATTTVRGLTISATSTKIVAIDDNNKSYGEGDDAISFTKRIKLGGAMGADYRHLSFAVTGDCTIEVYCMSAKNGEDRPLNIAASEWNNNLQQTSVTGSELNRVVCNYTGNATTIFIGSGNSGINIYGINLTYANTATDIEAENYASPISKSRKVIQNGEILIIHNADTYTTLGQRK